MFILDKKVELAKKNIIKQCGCETGCSVCAQKLKRVEMMAEANIPVNYWNLKLADFVGAPNIKEATEKYITTLPDRYADGTNLCFSGTLGTGKTYSLCCIVRAALYSGHTAYYTTLSDIIHYISNNEFKYKFYHKLTNVDFLIIDEVDSRYLSASDNAQNFFGSNFERIIRYRVQNGLPICLATNNAELRDVFTGQYAKSVDSLLSKITCVAALGKDRRKT